jgi:hypothetical protein
MQLVSDCANNPVRTVVIPLAVAATGYAVRAAYRRWLVSDWSDEKAIVRTMVVNVFGSRCNEGIRNQFQNDFEFQVKKKPLGHSHAESAANRTSAANSIKRWVTTAGFDPYYVSASSRDEEEDGFHQVFMGKDLMHPSSNDPIRDNHIIVMMDVDYYVDISKWVSYGRPIVLYTFVPTSVAGTTTDGHFTIISNNIKYRANGGAEYCHQLWDYSADVMLFNHWYGSTVCTIESRHVAPDRRVILITPEYKVWAPVSWMLQATTRSIGRAKFQHARGYDTQGLQACVNRLEFTKPGSGELFVSLGIEGHYSSVTFSATMFEGLFIRYFSAKHPDMISTAHFLRTEKVENAGQIAPVFWDCMNVIKTSFIYDHAYLPAGGSQPIATPANYVAIGRPEDGFLPDDSLPKINGRNVAPPIVAHSAVVPSGSYNNDLACLQGRLFCVYNNKVLNGNILDYMQEFAKLLIPDDIAHTLEPYGLNYVAANQRDPKKRAKYEQCIAWASMADEQYVKAFCKREPYSKVTHPRNISQFSTSHTLTMGSFIDRFTAEIMMEQDWYMPCRPPTEVADRICYLASNHEVLVEADQSRFDGYQSIAIAKFTRGLLARAFKPEYRDTIYKLCNSEIMAKGRTTHGIAYALAGSRGSGSKVTSSFNTDISGVGDYAALRRDGHTRQQAWANMGAYAGDDSVSTASEASIQSVWTEMGFSVKTIKHNRGDQVGFLGRIFLDPWETNWSMQDPMRTWMKLHISFAPSMLPDSHALVNRARGYLDLDPTTPIISDWCHKVLSLNQDVTLTDKQSNDGIVDVPWWARVKREFKSGGWPCAPLGHHLPLQRIAESTGFDTATIVDWQNTIRDCTDLEQLRGLIPNEPIKIDIPALFTTGNDPFTVLPVLEPIVQRDIPNARDVKRLLDDQSKRSSGSTGQSTPTSGAAGPSRKRGSRGSGNQKRQRERTCATATPTGKQPKLASQRDKQIERLAASFQANMSVINGTAKFQPHSPLNSPPPLD